MNIGQAPGLIQLQRGPSTGDVLAGGFSQGLQALADGKMRQITQHHQQILANQQRQQQQQEINLGLQKVGFTPEQSQQLAMLPLPILEEVVKGKLREGNEQAYSQALQGILGEGQQPMGPALQQSANGLPHGINSQQATKLVELQLQKKALGEKKEKEERDFQHKIDQDLKPILTEYTKDAKNAHHVKKVASEMLNYIEKHKDEFPGQAVGWLSEKTGVHLNPKVRTYMAKANQLVTLLAHSRRGQPTNFKIKLEQAAKPSVDKPIETQEELLRGIISDADEALNIPSTIEGIRQSNNGRYPSDLGQLLLKNQINQGDEQVAKKNKQPKHEESRQLDDGSWELYDAQQKKWRKAEVY